MLQVCKFLQVLFGPWQWGLEIVNYNFIYSLFWRRPRRLLLKCFWKTTVHTPENYLLQHLIPEVRVHTPENYLLKHLISEVRVHTPENYFLQHLIPEVRVHTPENYLLQHLIPEVRVHTPENYLLQHLIPEVRVHMYSRKLFAPTSDTRGKGPYSRKSFCFTPIYWLLLFTKYWQILYFRKFCLGSILTGILIWCNNITWLLSEGLLY